MNLSPLYQVGAAGRSSILSATSIRYKTAGGHLIGGFDTMFRQLTPHRHGVFD
jgi:hypothetical protein